MKVFANLTVSYRLRSAKSNFEKQAKVIYCRIYLNNERADFSTKQKIEDQTGVSKSTASRIINSYKIDDNILL